MLRRTEILAFRLSRSEQRLLARTAAREALRASTWARRTLLLAARAAQDSRGAKSKVGV
jgi:hypothetical protein